MGGGGVSHGMEHQTNPSYMIDATLSNDDSELEFLGETGHSASVALIVIINERVRATDQTQKT